MQCFICYIVVLMFVLISLNRFTADLESSMSIK